MSQNAVKSLTLPFQGLGAWLLAGFRRTGNIIFFALSGLKALLSPPFYGKVFFSTLLEISFLSLPVIALTAIFAGGVIALQSWTGFRQYHAENAIASIVMLAITRELGPVLGGLMIAGRVGASLAARIGAMRVTEQIDALQTLATQPMKYLVAPRLLAGTIALPLLVLIADILGVFGGFAVCTTKLGFSPVAYANASYAALKASDVMVGLVKAGVFGFLIALLGCYYGYKCKGGADGVGQAATATVVGASILLLTADYLLTDLFFAK